MKKRLTDYHEIYKVVRDELKDNKKSWWFRQVVDNDGSIGVVYQALENMYYHGKIMYPETYKYRKELSKHYKQYVKERSKAWEKSKL